MRTSERGHGPGARVVAGLAGAFVFAAGAATLTYVFEFRGTGLQAELAGVHGPELLILGGGLVLLTAAAFVVVSVLASRMSGGSKLHDLLQRARQLEVTDSEALKEFNEVPELRDMVAELVTEKAHARELSDRFESLRREVDGLVEGMHRSVEDGGHLREESSNSSVVQLAVLWNGVVDRLRNAKEASHSTTAAGVAPRDVTVPEITALVARLDELESELGRLRNAVGTPEAEPQRGNLGRAPEAELESETATPVTPRSWGEIEVGESTETVAGWNPPDPATVASDEPTRPARELFLDDDTFGPVEGYVEVASEPETGHQETHRMTDPFAPQSLLPSGLGEAPPAAHGAPAPPTAQRAPAAPAAQEPPAPPAFEEGMRFPEFVGGTGNAAQGRVELTYENQDSEDVVDLPASALLFENNPDDDDREPQSGEAVFDLRSFGATEFDQ